MLRQGLRTADIYTEGTRRIGTAEMGDALLAAQSEKGYWSQGVGQEQEAGEAYRTSMAVLALCVPYRYLPLYQK